MSPTDGFDRRRGQCAGCRHYFENVTYESCGSTGRAPGSTEEVLQLASMIMDLDCMAGGSVSEGSPCGMFKRRIRQEEERTA